MKNLSIVIVLLSLLCMGACEGLLDANDDPARVGSDEVTLQTLLPSAIQFSATATYGASQYAVQYPQYLAGQAISQYPPYGFDQLWGPFYTDALPTLQDIIVRAEEAGAFNYAGIAKVLLALNLMNAADMYGDVPYTEANKGTADLYPCYDPMQDLYEIHIIALLNEAVGDLEKPLSDQPSLQTVQNDYIYDGDLTKWIRAAHAVRARYYLHLSNRQPELLTNAIQEAQDAFTSNDDDLQLEYDEQVRNPWYGFLGNATNKIMQPSSYLVDLLSGRGIFEDVTDPRLPLYMTKTGEEADYIGLTSGLLIGEDPAVNVQVTADAWHAGATAPILFITYAEVQFILAEAHFGTDPTAAYEAYLTGIEASLTKVGVDPGAIAAYLADPEIAVGEANLTLADIMLQKYLALYLQIESWTDMRRYQYDPGVYVGIEKPVVNLIPGNPWVQRSKLADDEAGVNTCLPEVANQSVTLWLFE